jgi:DNA-binding transcriptional MerR regulator
MNVFTIKDLEHISGIKAHTIRIWEQRYNFLKPNRTDTNIRVYSNDELVKLLNIALLNKNGFKISSIDKMGAAEIQQKLMSLASADAQYERVINELIELMITMDVVRFEKLIDTYISSKGIEKTINQLLFPFLEKIGLLWITSRINAAQEHLVTNIIRQKLIIGIENAKPLIQINRSVLLFLPEGEHHELGLLYLHFLLKTKGLNVYYIGANVPIKDLAVVVVYKKPDILYTHITAAGKSFNFEKFLNYYHQAMPQFKLIMGGAQSQTYKKQLPDNVVVKRNLADVLHILA